MPPEKTPKRKPASVPLRKSVKTSLTVDADLHVRISAGASMRGMSNNALCVEILTDALRHLVIFDRRKSAGQVGPSDEVDRAAVA